MAFDLSLVGYQTSASSYTYDWKTLATYALGIGAKHDELEYLYENSKNGMKVYPTFAVVPVFPSVVDAIAKSGANMAMVVHGGQAIRIHRPIPAGGTLQTTGTLKGIYDLNKFAQLVIETTTSHNGERIFDTEWSIIVRGAGNFGGPRPPQNPDIEVPKGNTPDFTFTEATTKEQALLYRVSGDINPLHADPEFATMAGFPQGPILHGLCTYGHVARAAIKNIAGGDAAKLKSFSAQFRKPVWPGDTIVTTGYRMGGGRVVVTASVKDRPDPVLTNAWFEFSE